MFDRHFTLEVTDQAAVLARIVVLCQQRRCHVVALSFVAADRHRGGELSLTVRASNWHAERLAGWLGTLVDVVKVHDVSPHATFWGSRALCRPASRPRRPFTSDPQRAPSRLAAAVRAARRFACGSMHGDASPRRD